jgi:hypothetical protein
MPFVLKKRSSLPATISVEVESESKPGTYVAQQFKVRFEKLSQADYEDLMAAVRNDDMDVRSVLERVLVQIDDVNDEDGKAVPFETAKAALLDQTEVCTALFRGFVEAHLQAKSKNSKR